MPSKYSSTLTVEQITRAIEKAQGLQTNMPLARSIQVNNWIESSESDYAYEYQMSSLDMGGSNINPYVVFYNNDGMIYELHFQFDRSDTNESEIDLTLYSNKQMAGTVIINKQGVIYGDIDTSDATADANDILSNKTAYARGSKITGTIPTYNGEVN